jgi:2-dehydropantoate 2-reductase
MACRFGAGLAKIADVTLVGTWAEGLTEIRNNGIRISGRESEPVRVRVAFRNDFLEPADLVLILVKAWQTGEVAAYLNSWLKPDAVALTLQNGLGNARVLGPRACVGITEQGAALLGPGYVLPGGSGPTYAAVPDRVADLFQRAGFETYRCSEHEAEEHVWSKLAANCAINPLSALLQVKNGELLHSPEAVELMNRAAQECAGVARVKSIPLRYEDVAAYVRQVAVRTAENKSSMLQDIMRGARTECDAINGAVAREAAIVGLQAPVNEMLCRLVRAMEQTFQSNFRGV